MQRFNGQLINQFPTTINGNAAAGAQVTIRVKSSGALATLYATNSAGGATLPNPIIADSKGYYGFYAPDGVYTLDVSISGTPQLEIQLQDVAVLQAQFDGALANAGYIPVGTFSAGCTVSQSNGVVSDGSAYWRWDGALPKTVTAGSSPLPVGVGGWFLVSDGGLRGDLASASSSVSVAGIKAGDVERGNVLRYGAVSSDLAALINLALADCGSAYVPSGTYIHSGITVALDDNQSIFFENAVVESQVGSYAPFIFVDDKSGWSILGCCNYIGTLATSGDTGNEIGLDVKGSNRYTVENFKAYNCRSHGIRVRTGGSAPAPRGDQGQFIGCSAIECRVGVENGVDTSTEFNVWTNLTIAGCLDGLITPAGNAIYCGGNIVDNLRGLTITNGPNHAHGIISAMNINHNTDYNIKTIGVVYGQTIDACHVYGNGGTTSPIWFENSKGICVSNSHIDCPIYNDGATGRNAIINNHMPGADAQPLGTNPEQLVMLGNWTTLGAWIYNDPAFEFVNATRGSTGQSLSSGTVLVFNNEISDKRALYNSSTGVFTCPSGGFYSVESNIIMSATGMTTGAVIGYVAVKKGATDISYATVTAISSTLALCSISETVQASTSDQITLQSFASATGLAMAVNQSRLTIKLS